MIRAVLDTNVLVSAFLYGGPPLDVLDLAEAGVVEVYTSEDALAELHAVLSRDKFAGRLRSLRLSAPAIVSLYRRLAAVITPADVIGICSDPQDEEFIGIALAAGADVIVSGDRHLLDCADSSPIPVLTAAEFLLAVRDMMKSEPPP
jgi:putative PIN family toxin of toxin-antitoxin system